MSTPAQISTAIIAPAQSGSRPRAIQFETSGFAPPTALYVQPEDFLNIYINADTLLLNSFSVNVRMLLPSGQIVIGQYSIPTVAAGTGNNYSLSLPECFLLSVSVDFMNTSLFTGRAWASIRLGRIKAVFAQTGQLLAAGYVTPNYSVAFPGSNVTSVGAGAGWIHSITGSTPGAGADISETVPAGIRWRIISFVATLVTSVAVANRAPILQITDGTHTTYYGATPTIQGAGVSWAYTFGPGMQQIAGTQGVTGLPCPDGLKLGGGSQIKTLTNSLQAADQWSAPQYVVEQWVMDQ